MTTPQTWTRRVIEELGVLLPAARRDITSVIRRIMVFLGHLVVLLWGICWNIRWKTVVDIHLMSIVTDIDMGMAMIIIITIITSIVGVVVTHNTERENTLGFECFD